MPAKKIGFLSFGHWTPSPHSQTRSAADALLQTIDLAVAADGITYLTWEDDEDRNGVFQIHATALRPDRTRLLRRVTVNRKWRGQQRRPAVASR